MITTAHLKKQLSSAQRMLRLFQDKVQRGEIAADHPQIAIYENEIEGLQEYVAVRESKRRTA